MTRTAPQSVRDTQAQVQQRQGEQIGSPELERLLQADLIIKRCSPEALAGQSTMQRALTMARGIEEMRNLMDDEAMDVFYPLMGTQLGFRTDRDDKGGYTKEQVRDCLIVGFMNGAYATGNEINIISGRTYYTREFFSRKLREYPNLTDLRIAYGVPRNVGDRGALVPCKATWRIGEVNDGLGDFEIPIRVNSGMGADAILGKADRKAKARIYARLTGSDFTVDGEVDEEKANGAEVKAAEAQAAIDALKNATPAQESQQTSEPEKQPEPAQQPSGWRRSGQGQPPDATTTTAPKPEASQLGQAKSEPEPREPELAHEPGETPESQPQAEPQQTVFDPKPDQTKKPGKPAAPWQK